MTRIPVEQRKGTSVLPWILGFLVLLLIGWGVTELVDEDVDEVDMYTQVEPMDEGAANADGDAAMDAEVDVRQPMDVITTVNTIAESDDRVALAGREVSLADMRVTRVVGDRTFFVVPQGMDNARELLVVLNEQPTPEQPGIEGRYDVTAGQVIAIDGRLRELDVDPSEEWEITEAEAQGLTDDVIYVHAEKLNIE